MNKLFLLLVMVLLLVTVSAQSLTFQKNTEVNYRHRCLADNNYCSTANQLLISVEAPNGTNLLDNSTMTGNPTFYNHSLPTNQSGIHTVIIISPDGNSSTEFTYLVNPTGIPPSDQKTEAVSRGVWFMFGLGAMLLLASFFVTRKLPVRSTLVILASIFLLVGMNVIFVSMQDEVVNPRLENLFSFLTAASFYLYFFGFFLLIVIWIIALFQTVLVTRANNIARRFGNASP